MSTIGATEQRPRALGPLRLWALPLLLWAFAWCFHLGHTGPWSDDWFFEFRSPVTGEAYRHVLPTWGTTHHRPLHHVVMPLMETGLADMRWLAVLITAGGHGVAAASLWWVLRGMGFSRLPADASAMLWLVYPVLFDIPLWVAAVSTGLAMALALLVLRATIAMARGRSAWWLVALVPMAYAVCALNEQPAALFAALPMLGVMTGRSRRRGVLVGFGAAAACAVGVGVYLSLIMGAFPAIAGGLSAEERGSASRLVGSLGELREKWNQTQSQANDDMWMRGGMLRGAVQGGLAALRQGPVHAGWGWSLVWCAVLAGAGLLRLPRLRHEMRSEHPMPLRPALRLGLWGVAIGWTVFFAGFVPMLVMRDQPFYTRLACVPAAGLAILTSVVFEAALRNTMLIPRLGRLARVIVAAGSGLAIALWALACVGMQEGLYRRTIQDRAEADRLVALAPEPAPGACVIFVRYDHRVMRTGHIGYDSRFPGAANVTWATPSFVKRAYKRWDVWAVGLWHGHGPPVRRVDDLGLWLDPRLVFDVAMSQIKPPLPEPYFVPWERAVLVAVDEQGRVSTVPREELEALLAHPR